MNDLLVFLVKHKQYLEYLQAESQRAESDFMDKHGVKTAIEATQTAIELMENIILQEEM